MRRHRITDDDAAALAKGEAPAGRPDLARLADSIAEFRTAASASPPRPSAELQTRLGLAPAAGISTEAIPARDAATIGTASGAPPRRAVPLGRMKRMFAWFTGLGIAAKVALGVTVAAAAGATGVGAVAGIGTLVESSTDQEQIAPTDEPTLVPEPTESATPGEFGESVSERARELGKDSDGAAFGDEVSDEAQQLGDDHAEEAENGDAGDDHAVEPELPEPTPDTVP